MAEFNAHTRERGEVSVVDISGYLDAHTAPRLENAFTDLVEKRKYNIVVNFQNLDYISSAGLGVFMAFIETMRTNGGDIKLSSMKPKVYDIFDLLGFPLLYDIYHAEDEAITRFQDPPKDDKA